jgi:hypothetical protein
MKMIHETCIISINHGVEKLFTSFLLYVETVTILGNNVPVYYTPSLMQDSFDVILCNLPYIIYSNYDPTSELPDHFLELSDWRF